MAESNTFSTPEARAAHAERTRRGKLRARAERERRASLALWAVRQLERMPAGELRGSLLDEAVRRLDAFLVDMGGEDQVSAKERAVLEGAVAARMAWELMLLWLLQHPDGERAKDAASRIGALIGQERTCLQAVGLERRPRQVEGMLDALRERVRPAVPVEAQTAQVRAGAANGSELESAVAPHLNGAEQPQARARCSVAARSGTDSTHDQGSPEIGEPGAAQELA